MNTVQTPKPQSTPDPKTTNYIVLGLVILCLSSTAYVINNIWQLPMSQLFAPAMSLSLSDMARQMQIVPTMLITLLAGGLLGLSSSLLQQIIKNPLVSDTTLAVGSGANMALLLGSVFLPQFIPFEQLGGAWYLEWGSFGLCFVGAMLSMACVLGLTKHKDSTSLILVGLIVTILLSAISSLLFIFYADSSYGVMAWGAGFVRQTGYFGVHLLSYVSIFAIIAIVLLYKPLVVVSLDDDYAKTLGIHVKRFRLLSFTVCGILVASVISQLGIIGFIGLGATTLVNALSPKKIWHRLSLSFVMGAMLLLLAYNATYLLQSFILTPLAEGILSGIFGAILIIWLIIKTNKQSLDTPQKPLPALVYRPKRYIAIGMVFLGLIIPMLLITPYANLLSVPAVMTDLAFIGEFRLPRTLFAIATGILLATSGCLLQAITKNTMASPEVLGVSSSAALGVVLMFIFANFLGLPTHLGVLVIGGACGAVVMCLLLSVLAKRLKPSNLLLIGIGVSALSGSVLSLIKLLGDMRLQAILSWLSGTTYYANSTSSFYVFIASIVLFLVSYTIIKPLQLIGLSDELAQSLGVNLHRYRLITLMLVALMSAMATLAVGPLSFVGLITPHLAHRLGATKLPTKLPLSALLGAMIMASADYIGRYVIFPYEIPMGVIAGIIGGGYFIYLMSELRTTA